MLQKLALTNAVVAVIVAGFAGGAPLHANEGMMPQIPRDITSVDDTLAWTVPAGWKEVPASGMRLASMVSATQPEAIDVSIISLGPGAGALEPNLERWAGQVDAPADAAAVQKLIDSAVAVKTGLDPDVKIFDFSVLLGGRETSAKSMLTSIIRTEGAVIFVKMTGTLETIAANKDSFKELVGSIHNKS